MHLPSPDSTTFELFLYWQPYNAYNTYEKQRSDYIFFDSTIGATVDSDVFHVAFSQWQTPVVQALEAHQPQNVLNKPVEKCELLQNGQVRLLSSQA